MRHRPGIRRQHAGQQIEQRGLPRPIRPDDPDPVAAQNPRGKIPHDDAIAERFRHAFGHSDQPAGQFRVRRPQLHVAGGAAQFLTLLAQCVQIGQPLLIALTARGHAVTQPILLHHDLAAEFVPLACLLFQHRVAPCLKSGKSRIQLPCDPAIEPHRDARQPLQQPAVVTDQHDPRTKIAQFAFQPLDARQVKVVGRFVQQQNVRFGRQHARQRHAPGLTSGQAGRVLGTVQSELFQQIRGAMPVARRAIVEPGLDISQCRTEFGKVRFLR